MIAVQTVDPCPLCGATEARRLLQIPYARIWQALEDVWSARLSGEVRTRHQPGSEAKLYDCTACGLEYFSPIVPGDPEFYRQLMASMPYHDERWEFGIVAGLIERGASVMDLGCGSGAFLRTLRGRAGRALGIDHNPDAIRELSRAGFEAVGGDFGALASREADAFDVACSFHTLEHLPWVGELMETAVACTRSGGRIFVSVPNRDRIGRGELEPLDCPPHHISRWSERQLRVLADRFGLELVATRFEEPGFRVARTTHATRGGERAGGRGREPSPVHRWMRAVVDPWTYLWRRRNRAYTRAGIYGHSMLAEFRCP